MKFRSGLAGECRELECCAFMGRGPIPPQFRRIGPGCAHPEDVDESDLPEPFHGYRGFDGPLVLNKMRGDQKLPGFLEGLDSSSAKNAVGSCRIHREGKTQVAADRCVL